MTRESGWSSRSPGVFLFVLSLRELFRHRFGLLLLLVIPPAFLGIVELTSGVLTVPLDLGGCYDLRGVLADLHVPVVRKHALARLFHPAFEPKPSAYPGGEPCCRSHEQPDQHAASSHCAAKLSTARASRLFVK